MSVRIWRRVLLGIGLTALLLTITIGVVIWRWHAGGQCVAFGAAYTPIGELKIDGRPYYVYGAVTGFQDKVRIVQVSTARIPETVCKPEHTAQVVGPKRSMRPRLFPRSCFVASRAADWT